MPTLEYKAGVFALTAICGLVDVACFLALGGVFAELMTGNLLLMGITIGGGAFTWARVAVYLSAIVPFCVGALIAGIMANGKYRFAVRVIGYPVEFAAVLLATILAVILNPTKLILAGQFQAADGYVWQRMTIVGLLAFGMGIHNALMRKHGVPDIATNVLTLTLTGLFSESHLAGGPATHWKRRLGSILIFVGGAIAGAWLLQFGVAAPLIAATAIFAVALLPLMKGRSKDAPATTTAFVPGPPDARAP